MFSRLKLLIFCVVFASASVVAQVTVSPFLGLGNAQWLDNNGKPLTGGVLYSYQAGTTIQQATYTDSTATVLNSNPITFGSGARVSIWLVTVDTYKFVLCAQNDGASCAPADTLFSVDNVPGGSSGGGGTTGTFTGILQSSSTGPATTGVVRLASSDSICWRNQAGTANLCLFKDSADILNWGGGAIKLPATVGPTTCPSNQGVVWYDQTAQTFKQCSNGSGQFYVPSAGGPNQDINSSSQIVGLHFGTNQYTFCGNAPVLNWFLQVNAGNTLCPQPTEATLGFAQAAAIVLGPSAGGCNASPPTICAIANYSGPHTIIRFDFVLALQAVSCSTNAVIGIRDLTANSNVYAVTITPAMNGYVDSGALAIALPSGHEIGVGLLTSSAGCTTNPAITSIYMVYS